MASKQDYPVVCHRCPADWAMVQGERGQAVPRLPRSKATLHGTPDYGALWHCPEHADDCPTCPHGSWCDESCKAQK